jgi:hypothetical protein
MLLAGTEAFRAYSVDAYDVSNALMIDSGCAAIGFAAGVAERQKVLPVHVVIQGLETKVTRSLRFRV